VRRGRARLVLRLGEVRLAAARVLLVAPVLVAPVLEARLAVARFIAVRLVLDLDFGRATDRFVADCFVAVRAVRFAALALRGFPRVARVPVEAALFWRGEAFLADPVARETARLRDDFLVAIRCSGADR
jgi:hypothetical protein